MKRKIFALLSAAFLMTACAGEKSVEETGYVCITPQEAKEIMEYTYGISPHIIIIINDQAASHIFGDDLLDNIRQHDWGEGNSRGDAVAMNIYGEQDMKIFESGVEYFK